MSGTCNDPGLVQGSAQLASAVRKLIGGQLLSGDSIRAQLLDPPAGSPRGYDRPRQRAPSGTRDPVRWIREAEGSYTEGQVEGVAKLAEQALDDTRYLLPGQACLDLQLRAKRLWAITEVWANHRARAESLFREILLVNPGFNLDSGDPPQARELLDQLRAEMSKIPPAKLKVSVVPSTSDIFLDCNKVPHEEVVARPGFYELVASDQTGRSLPHWISVPQEEPISINLLFERAVQLDLDPCISMDVDDPSFRLSGSLELAQRLGLETILVTHLIVAQRQPGTLAVSMLDTRSRKQLRYIELKLDATLTPQVLEDVARVLLGKTKAEKEPSARTLADIGHTLSENARDWYRFASAIPGFDLSPHDVPAMGDLPWTWAGLGSNPAPRHIVFTRQMQVARAVKAKQETSHILIQLDGQLTRTALAVPGDQAVFAANGGFAGKFNSLRPGDVLDVYFHIQMGKVQLDELAIHGSLSAREALRRGSLLLETGDMANAHAQFRTALILEPAIGLPTRAPPEARHILEKIKASMAEGAKSDQP